MRKSAEIEERNFHISRFRFFWSYVLVFLLPAGAILWYNSGGSLVTTSILLIGFIVLLSLLEMKVRAKCISVKKMALVIENGVFAKQTSRIAYSQISYIHVRQTAFQRLLGYGDFEVGVPGEVTMHYFAGTGAVNINNDATAPKGIIISGVQNVRKAEELIIAKIHDLAGGRHHSTSIQDAGTIGQKSSQQKR